MKLEDRIREQNYYGMEVWDGIRGQIQYRIWDNITGQSYRITGWNQRTVLKDYRAELQDIISGQNNLT